MDINPSQTETRRNMLRRWEALKTERSSWVTHYRELSSFVQPRSGRFLISDRNKGDKRYNNIYDSTSTRCLRVLSAGLMSGATSPARPWFRLATADPEMMKSEAVKVWCSKATQIILDVFARSNTYRALHNIYEELGVFSTGASIMVDDFDTVIHDFPLTAGEYCLATDWKGNVNTMYREFESTVGSVVPEFGYENCSTFVQNNWNNSNYDVWVPIIHAIEPRGDRDVTKRDNKNMPFKSLYFEPGSGSDERLLRQSGFEDFRVLAPRWNVSGGDIYGSSGSAMEALGDIKQLQHQQLRKGTAIDYQVDPPLQIPTLLKNNPQKRLPGGEYYVDQTTPGGGVRTAYDVNLRLDYLLQDIQDVRGRIREAFYYDLFLMLAQDDRSGITATEVAERHEEKLLMLGPVIERLHNELLQRKVDMTFTRCIRLGIVPPPPDELQGQELNVEFVSILAQAQRAISTNSTDRFVGSLGMVAKFKPDVLDKFDADAWAEKYSDDLGVDPSLIVPDEKVALIRSGRAQQMQQAQTSALMNQGADTVNKMGNTPAPGDNALGSVLQNLQGYGSPSPGGV